MPVRCAVPIKAGARTSNVVLDGKITTPNEWPDQLAVDLKLLKGHKGPEEITGRVWLQNDDQWLYVLIRAPHSKEKSPKDWGWVAYFSGWSNKSRDPSWEFSDHGAVCMTNETFDGWGWNEQSWKDDTKATPPGQNNVEGAATNDGTYSWFEFRKALNSKDGRDWTFEKGQTIGNPNAPQEGPLFQFSLTLIFFE